MEEKPEYRGSFSDGWEEHKDDILWRKFWALWELKRKWNWTDWFYQRIDRDDNEVVAPECWSLTGGGEGFMKLCFWIASLYSLHEGMTKSLDSYHIPNENKVHPFKVFVNLPQNIIEFPTSKGTPFKDFRNAVFHCQWAPILSKLKLDQSTTNQLDFLHKEIGNWVNQEFKNCYYEFGRSYQIPTNWVYLENGEEFMPECF